MRRGGGAGTGIGSRSPRFVAPARAGRDGHALLRTTTRTLHAISPADASTGRREPYSVLRRATRRPSTVTAVATAAVPVLRRDRIRWTHPIGPAPATRRRPARPWPR